MNSKPFRTEEGQSILLMAVTMIILLGFAALAIDGGRLYTQRRDAQNGADAGALAAARAKCSTPPTDPLAAARTWATKSGYNNNGTTNTVSAVSPPTIDPYTTRHYYTQVSITATIASTLAQMVYRGPLQTTVTSIGHCMPSYTIMGIDTACSNTLQMSASSTTVSGGMHSNNDIHLSGGGSGSQVFGPVTYSTGSLDSNNVSFEQTPSLEGPETVSLHYNINDYAPGGVKAVAAGSHYYNLSCGDPNATSCTINRSWLTDPTHRLYNTVNNRLTDGLYYSDGSIDLSGMPVVANRVTFVARREILIHLSSAINNGGYSDNLLAMTDYTEGCSTPVIKLTGSGYTLNGDLYAPYGQIYINTSGMTLVGKVVGDTVNLTGSNQVISSPNIPRIELAK